MTRLLVSVRSVDEALLAAAAGVDLIDVKEPTLGPLGMATAEVRREIGQRLGTQHLLSAACGELRDFATSFETRSVSEGGKRSDSGCEPYSSAAWTNYRYAKIGLAGCARDPDWRERWLAWRAALPSFVEPVLVCYADAERCDAPSFDELRTFAVEQRLGLMLFDTWDKHGPGLWGLWQTADLLRVSKELREARIEFVLAGKLRLEQVSALRRLGASYLGIRGSACESEQAIDDVRCGKISAAKIETWRAALVVPTCNPSLPPTSIVA